MTCPHCNEPMSRVTIGPVGGDLVGWVCDECGCEWDGENDVEHERQSYGDY